MRGSKTIKYIFFVLLPLFLLLMLFSYNSKPFMGAKCSAFSSTNTITFYDDDNTIINSYSVLGGHSINSTNITTEVTNKYPIVFDNTYTSISTSNTSNYVFNDERTLFARYSNCSSNGYTSVSAMSFLSTSSVNRYSSIAVLLSDLVSNTDYNLSLTLNTYLMSTMSNYSFHFNYVKVLKDATTYTNIINFGSFNVASSSITNALVTELDYTFNTGDIDYTTYDYYLMGTLKMTTGTGYNQNQFRYSFTIDDLSYSQTETTVIPLSNIINQDLYTAYTNGRLKNYENNNYSWSLLSNYNTDFTYDNNIYYDTNLYLVHKEKIFDFSKGAFDILGTLSNQTFYTDTALKELMQNFSSFAQISFNGDFIDVLKAIGLSLLNVFKIILALFKLLVYPIVDLIGIITLLITKSNAFWRFI